MKIGLDFDGVISDCGDLKSIGAKELYDVEIAPRDFKKEIVLPNGWLTADQYRNIQEAVYATRLGLQMKPVPEMSSYLPLLAQFFEVVIITSRTNKALAIAQEWTLNQGLDLPFVGVGRGSKAVAATGFDAFVDDDLDKLEPLVGVVPYRFLFSWGYNSHLDAGKVATRVATWKELYLHLKWLSALLDS